MMAQKNENESLKFSRICIKFGLKIMAQKLETKTDSVRRFKNTKKSSFVRPCISWGTLGFLKKMSSNLMYVYI